MMICNHKLQCHAKKFFNLQGHGHSEDLYSQMMTDFTYIFWTNDSFATG